MYFVGGGGLGTTGVVPIQMTAARVEIRNRRHLSTVQMLLSLKVMGVFHRLVFLPPRNVPRQSLLRQMPLMRANVKPLAIGRGTRPWITGAGDHVAAAIAQATCVPVRKKKTVLSLQCC